MLWIMTSRRRCAAGHGTVVVVVGCVSASDNIRSGAIGGGGGTGGGDVVDGVRVGRAALIGLTVGAIGTTGADGDAGADVCRRRRTGIDHLAARAAIGAVDRGRVGRGAAPVCHGGGETTSGAVGDTTTGGAVGDTPLRRGDSGATARFAGGCRRTRGDARSSPAPEALAPVSAAAATEAAAAAAAEVASVTPAADAFSAARPGSSPVTPAGPVCPCFDCEDILMVTPFVAGPPAAAASATADASVPGRWYPRPRPPPRRRPQSAPPTGRCARRCRPPPSPGGWRPRGMRTDSLPRRSATTMPRAWPPPVPLPPPLQQSPRWRPPRRRKGG